MRCYAIRTDRIVAAEQPALRLHNLFLDFRTGFDQLPFYRCVLDETELRDGRFPLPDVTLIGRARPQEDQW